MKHSIATPKYIEYSSKKRIETLKCENRVSNIVLLLI